MWVQPSEQKYLFPLHHVNPHNCVDSIFSLHLQTPLHCVALVSATVLVAVHAMDLLPSPLSSPQCVSNHGLDGWSVGTRCVAFHISTSFLHLTIFSACTHDHLSQPFHLTKYIHCPSIYLRPATASTSNSSNFSYSSTCVVLGIQISQAPYLPSLLVKNLLCGQLFTLPASSAPSGSPSRYIPKLWATHLWWLRTQADWCFSLSCTSSSQGTRIWVVFDSIPE